jgi:hypothetical protein
VIISIASLTVKLAGLARGGNFSKLSSHCAMMAWAGTRTTVKEGQAGCNMGRLLRDNQRIARISAQALCWKHQQYSV